MPEVTRESKTGYYGRPLDTDRADEPKVSRVLLPLAWFSAARLSACRSLVAGRVFAGCLVILTLAVSSVAVGSALASTVAVTAILIVLNVGQLCRGAGINCSS